MYNSLYYIFTKDYNDDYSNSTLYLKDKNNKMKIMIDSKNKEFNYLKRKYDKLCHRYNSIEWKYNELLLNTHYSKEYYNRLEIKYNNLLKKYNESLDNDNKMYDDVQIINDDYEQI
jgi:hypothetical protein